MLALPSPHEIVSVLTLFQSISIPYQDLPAHIAGYTDHLVSGVRVGEIRWKQTIAKSNFMYI